MSRTRVILVQWGILVGMGAVALWLLPISPPAPAGRGGTLGMGAMEMMGISSPQPGAEGRDWDATPDGASFEGEEESREAFGEDTWERLEMASEAEKLIRSLASVILAAILGALIAYHPSNRPRGGAFLEDVETPQIRIVVAVAAAIIIMAVLYVGVAIAFAIFGLSGFVRVFRVRLKSANDISMILLCACVGMISGFQEFTLAIAVTAFVWILIWLLEGRGGGLEAEGGEWVEARAGGGVGVQSGGELEARGAGAVEPWGSGAVEPRRAGGREAQAAGAGEPRAGGPAAHLRVAIRAITEGAETRYRAEVDGAFGEGSTRKRAVGNLWDRHPDVFPPIEVQQSSAGFTARFKNNPGIALLTSEAKKTKKRAVGALLLEFGAELGVEIADEAQPEPPLTAGGGSGRER